MLAEFFYQAAMIALAGFLVGLGFQLAKKVIKA
jgi:hypothetical protein